MFQNGCETCFSFNDDQDSSPTTPQEKTGEEAGAAFPNNRLWNRTRLRVYFLNPIPSSWTYRGYKFTVPNGQPGHVIDKSDIIRLANKWSIHHPSFSKKECDCVPSFVEDESPEDSDIRVWFRSKLLHLLCNFACVMTRILYIQQMKGVVPILVQLLKMYPKETRKIMPQCISI